MRLNPAAFNAFLSGNIGQNVRWRPSTACPCVTPFSGAAKPDCPVCSGKGHVWSTPINCKTGVASQKVTRQWAQFGQYQSGDAVLSIPEDSPLYEAGRFDRITMLNGSDRFSLALVRGQADRLYFQVKDIVRVYWYQPDGQTVVEGGIPTVGDDGSLAWTSGAPPAGTTYSITGDAFSEYFIYDSLSSDRSEHFGARLPKNLVVRKFDLFGR